MVGDEDFVKHALKLGVKLGDASVSLGNIEGAQRRQAARGRHRHLDRGRLERVPALHRARPSCRKPGSAGTTDADAGRDRPLHGHDRARGQARRALARRPRLLVRGPLGLDREPRDGSNEPRHQRPLQQHELRDHQRGGRERQPGRHAALLADAPRPAPVVHPDAVRAHGPEAAGRRPAEGHPDRLHRGAAARSSSSSRSSSSPTRSRSTATAGRRTTRSASRCKRTTACVEVRRRRVRVRRPRVGARRGATTRTRC